MTSWSPKTQTNPSLYTEPNRPGSAYNPPVIVQIAGPQGPTGPQGPPGATILSGTSNPTNATGSNGDFYLNKSTNYFYGPKTNGAWDLGSGVLIQGTQGPQGPTGPEGPLNDTYTVSATAPVAPSYGDIWVAPDEQPETTVLLETYNKNFARDFLFGVTL